MTVRASTAFALGLSLLASSALAQNTSLREGFDDAIPVHDAEDRASVLRDGLKYTNADHLIALQLSGILNDEPLRGTVASVLAEEPEFLEALAAVEVSAVSKTALIANLLPVIEGFVDSPVATSSPTSSGSLNEATAGITASWTLFSADWVYRRKAAKALENAAIADARNVAASLIRNAASGRLDAIVLMHQLDVIDRRMARLGQLSKTVEAKVAKGLAYGVDRDRMAAEMNATRRERANLRSALEKLRNDKVVAQWLDGSGHLRNFERHSILDSYNLDDLVLMAKQNSAAIEASRHRMDAQDNEVAAARADLLPKLSLNASWQTGINTQNQDDSYGVSLRLRVPLFQPGTYANSARQEAVRDQTIASYAKSVHDVERSIRDLWADRTALIESLDSARREATARRNIAQAEFARAEAGFSSMEAAIAAQNESDSAEIQRITAEASITDIENAIVLATGLNSPAMAR